ncbi:MAG: hypothetical protein V2A74_10635, partial [bacterium]
MGLSWLFSSLRRSSSGGEVVKHVLVYRGVAQTGLIAPRRLGLLIGWLAAAGIATLLNPYVWELWTFPLKVMKHDVFYQMIIEWMPPEFPFFLPFWIVLLVVSGILIPVWRKVDLADLLVILFWSYMSLKARRNISLFAYVCLPLVAVYVNRLAEQLGERGAARWARGRWIPRAIMGLLAALTLWATLIVARQMLRNIPYERGAGPELG